MGKLFILFLISATLSFIFLSHIVIAVNFNLTLKGKSGNLSAAFDTMSDERAIRGIDQFDRISIKEEGEYARFYSNVVGIELSRDVWNLSLVPNRIFNVTFETYPKNINILDINWNFEQNGFEAYLIDFGNSLNYSTNYSSPINMKDITNYSIQFDGIRYFQLNLTYLYPNESLVLNRSDNLGNALLSFEDCFNESLCTNWNNCQLLELGYDKRVLNQEDYVNLKKYCLVANYSDDICGYQARKCDFTKICPSINLSTQYQICYYSDNPSCSDDLKNCHDGKCEQDTDCGGPCESECRSKKSINLQYVSNYLLVVFGISFLIAGIFISILLIRRVLKRKSQELNWYNLNRV